MIFLYAADHVVDAISLLAALIDAQADAVVGDRDGDGGWIDGKRRMHVRGMGVLRDVYQRLAEGLMDGVFDSQRGRRCADAGW